MGDRTHEGYPPSPMVDSFQSLTPASLHATNVEWHLPCARSSSEGTVTNGAEANASLPGMAYILGRTVKQGSE